MTGSPLVAEVVFQVGPVPVTLPVVTTWGLMAVMCASAFLITRRPSRARVAAEIVVTTLQRQLGDTMQGDAGPYLPLLGTLFLYVATANLTGLLPGLKPPTGAIETDAALALVVFVATHLYGIRRRGAVDYLRGFAHPTIVMLPLNLLGEVTRVFSLMVRLFGNVMSGEFVIGIMVALAGLFVPVPLMFLDLLTGLVQAYIFTTLAAVFIAGAVGTIEKG